MTDERTLDRYLGEILVGFQLIKMTEAYNTNDDGKRNGSIGYFKDADTAKAFIGPRAENPYKRTREVIVLTNGEVGFVVNESEKVILIDDEDALLQIKETAAAKLTPEERKVLGLE